MYTKAQKEHLLSVFAAAYDIAYKNKSFSPISIALVLGEKNVQPIYSAVTELERVGFVRKGKEDRYTTTTLGNSRYSAISKKTN